MPCPSFWGASIPASHRWYWTISALCWPTLPCKPDAPLWAGVPGPLHVRPSGCFTESLDITTCLQLVPHPFWPGPRRWRCSHGLWAIGLQGYQPLSRHLTALGLFSQFFQTLYTQPGESVQLFRRHLKISLWLCQAQMLTKELGDGTVIGTMPATTEIAGQVTGVKGCHLQAVSQLSAWQALQCFKHPDNNSFAIFH